MQANTAGANSPYDDKAVEQLINRVEDLEATVADQAETIDDLKDTVADQAETIDDLEEQLEAEADRRSAEIEGAHNRISGLKEEIEVANPTPDAEETTIQRADLTPVEQLSQADDPGEVTDSPTIERAISLFKNLPKWGSKTPKGIVLKPADNPLSLLEADRDESLAWKQYYRAAETLEKLSQGSVTFFDSDRHGKMIVLHERSEAYDRVVNGTLTASSAEATT